MTKMFEEFIRSDIDQLQEFEKEPKGELTLIISEKFEYKKEIQKLSESDKRNIEKMIEKLKNF